MSILEALQPHMAAGLKLSKSMMKPAVRAKASPAVAAVAALEVLGVCCEQTGTYFPAFLGEVATEMHAVIQRQNDAAQAAATPTTESTT